MSHEDGEPSPNPLAGRSVDDAVEAVVTADESRHPDEVRRVLSHVSEDGVVTTDAADEAVAHLSKVVSTPETRTELAAIELSDARDAAEPVAHLDVVQARLDQYETRLDALEAHLPELAEELRDLAADDRTDLYEFARRVQRLTTAANTTQQAADELQVDLEEFERWLSDDEERYDAFADELGALDDSLDHLLRVANEVVAAVDDDEETTLQGDPKSAWLDAAFRYRTVSLLLADLRAELTDLRTWPDTEPTARVEELDSRLDYLENRWETLGDRLDDAPRAWHEQFGAALERFDAALEAFEPPLDWRAVQTTLEEHRAQVDELA